jgi:hypothetical protein
LSRLFIVLAAVLVAILAGTIVPPKGAEAAASNLLLNQFCDSSTGRVRISYSWKSSTPSVSQQWVDVSASNNGWLPGTFWGSGPHSPSVGSHHWTNLLPNKVYYLRINQRLSTGGWSTSPTWYFTTRSCLKTSTPSFTLSDDLFDLIFRTNTTTQNSGPCHPSYGGACLDRNATDFDCVGNGGDGPYYTGQVTIVGPDVYGLDGDNDGIGCDWSLPASNYTSLPGNLPYYSSGGSSSTNSGSSGGSCGAGYTYIAGACHPNIPYAGNGGGPTLCNDGTVSNSSGSGTCSHHGGVAH